MYTSSTDGRNQPEHAALALLTITCCENSHILRIPSTHLILNNIPISLYFFFNILYIPEDWNPNIVKNFIVSFLHRKSILYQLYTTTERDNLK